MEKLVNLIKDRLGKYNLAESAQSSEVMFATNRFLTELFGKANPPAKAYKLEAGILYVAVQNSIWAQELWGIQTALLKKLQDHFGNKGVTKICVKCLTIG